jgi:hypothetical protein
MFSASATTGNSRVAGLLLHRLLLLLSLPLFSLRRAAASRSRKRRREAKGVGEELLAHEALDLEFEGKIKNWKFEEGKK